MDAELRQVANGFDFKVRSFDKYDINGYRFRTYGKELSMAGRKSTNCCVSAIGEGGIEYYGRVEAIYELLFYGANPPNVVVFKCHWFQPKETRRTHENLGLVEIKQRTHFTTKKNTSVTFWAERIFFYHTYDTSITIIVKKPGIIIDVVGSYFYDKKWAFRPGRAGDTAAW